MCDGDIQAERERRYYQTIKTGMTENRLPCLLLHERLGGLLSVLRTSALGMHLHDHHVCAHGPTVQIIQKAHLL